jgi:hypothetical protein
MIDSTHSLILICAFLLSACQQESSQPSSSCEPISVDMYIVEFTDLNPSPEPLDQEISNMCPELLCEESPSLHRMWQEMSIQGLLKCCQMRITHPMQQLDVFSVKHLRTVTIAQSESDRLITALSIKYI